MNTASVPAPNAVFDYKTLRSLIGLIAFALPFVTDAVSSKRLPSISASYYTEGHDAFFGMLLVIAALWLAYNGFSRKEMIASKVAAITTVLVAVVPTNCDGCGISLPSSIHYGSAAISLIVLAYFCFVPFRERALTKGEKGVRRARIYKICGYVIALCLLVAGIKEIVQFIWPTVHLDSYRITYWMETISLITFGFAWIVAGKILPPLAAHEERLKMPWEQTATALQK